MSNGLLKFYKCVNNHFFFVEVCPYCNERPIENVPYFEGDCINCGWICQRGQYSCDTPDPLDQERFRRLQDGGRNPAQG